MSNFGNYYDVNSVEAQKGFEALPPGEYSAIAIEGDIVETKDKTGKMAKFQFQIIEGELKDRQLFTNFNIINKNEQASAIGRAQLKNFATVCGKPHATDCKELLNIPVVLVVGVQKNNPEYNEVKNIKPHGAKASTPATSGKPSWVK